MNQPIQWHALSPEETLRALNSRKHGLTKQEVNERVLTYGLNEITEDKKGTKIKMFLSQFTNLMTLILIAAVIISFLIGETIDASAILIIVIINAILGFVQEFKAEKAMEALKSMSAPKAVVVREGRQEVISSKELVPGDIVVLSVGDIAPANIRLIEAVNTKVDQSHLTGESVPVTKRVNKLPEKTLLADRDNMVFMDSKITSGNSIGIVTSTGMNTEIGMLARTVSMEEDEETPLQKEISTLGKWIAIIVISLVIAVFLLGVLYNKELIESFITSVSLAVSAIPEGLPAVITITLAIGMQRMASKKAIVRRLDAVETLGSVNVICSDKTGTLTRNEMTVTNVFDGLHDYEVTGSGYAPEGKFLSEKKQVNPAEHEPLRLLLLSGALCNKSYYGSKEGVYSIVGDPTEGCLLALSAKAGIWKEELLKVYKEINEVSFTSERKMMSSVYLTSKGVYVFSKGAPDVMIKHCSKMQKGNNVVALTNEARNNIIAKNDELASKALRVLALAYKPSRNERMSEHEIEQDLVFLGLVGMIDPARPEVKDAINLAHQAGIRVIMITGDHKNTAIAIGREVGLFDREGVAFSGDDINNMTNEQFSQAVDTASIFARISPEDKLRIVQELKNKGDIVGVTGDGVNDAPALKSAHIGIAMGIKGTEVSKQASDMVLSDDNFSTIIKAVHEGRNIFENVKKFLKFLLACNGGSIIAVAFAVIMGWPAPYYPIQILWLNLISDGIPAVALSLDTTKNVMNRKPRNTSKSLISELALFILFAGLVNAVTSVIVYSISLQMEGYFLNPTQLALDKARTMAISSAVIYELFFVFNCRDDTKSFWKRKIKENFKTNPLLTASVFVSLILQLAFIYDPLLQGAFKTIPLNINELGIVFFFASLGLFVNPVWFNRQVRQINKSILTR